MRRAILLISRRTKRIFLSATVVSAVALALLAVSAAWARGRLTPATHDQAAVAPSAANAPGPAALQGNDPEGRLEVELITVRPDGFEPAEIIRADGRFLLAVENRSGLEDLVMFTPDLGDVRNFHRRLR